MFKYKIKNVLKFYIFTQIRVNLFQTLKDENEEFIELFEMEKNK
jgi:hypothetical protein